MFSFENIKQQFVVVEIEWTDIINGGTYGINSVIGID